MAGGVNRVMLVGHLGHDPSVRELPSQDKTATMRVATTRTASGREFTEWHRVIAHGMLADQCEQHGKKGRQVYVEGSLRTREWEPTRGPNKGRTLYVTEVIVKRIDFLDSKPGPQRQPGED